MSKREHLQFLVLMVPTFVILVAAAVSVANRSSPAPASQYSVAALAEELLDL
jgi:hypothetical protein